jgi:hypothetical protein
VFLDLALDLLYLHGPDGQQEIEINVAEVSSVREPREGAQGHFAPGTHCLIYMTSGQFIPVHEGCAEIIRLLVRHR